MILQALVDQYEALAAQGKLPREGWSNIKVSYALSLSERGELLDVVSLQKEQQKGKTTELVPREMVLPTQVKRTVAIIPNFLCDNSSYMLGVDNKGKPQRSVQCFGANAALHRKVLADVDTPAARGVLGFFEGWNPEEAATHPALAEHLEDIVKGANLVFRVAGAFAQEDEAIRESWRRYCEQSEAGKTTQCLVTGQEAAPARLHPSIRGVAGGQSSGVSLVSFNADAYESYGKKQGQNAPVGAYAAFAYGAALGHMIGDRAHQLRLGDTTVVFWAAGAQVATMDYFMTAMNADDAQISTGDLTKSMQLLSEGRTIDWKEDRISPETPFFILGLSPNAARLSVRFFLQNSFGFFVKRMLEHQRRLEIVRPAYDKYEQIPFWALLRETVNMNSRDKKPTPLLEGELMRAVLMGERYPASLLNGVVLRIRAEREVTRGRAAILKAYYLKNPHPDIPKEVLTVQLNDSDNIPYRLGRAFSVLEGIQQAANPNVNTTIKDKYFNSAAATPATIFPILLNLKEKHARKLETGLRVHYEKQLAEVLAPVAEQGSFPTRMNLPQQGAFQLGYYHQTQKRYQKKEEAANV